MLSLGVDPDLHHTGIALIDESGAVVGVRCLRAPTKTSEAAAVLAMAAAFECEWFGHSLPNDLIVTVEGQELYLGGGTKNPRNILHLAQVAGAAVVAAKMQSMSVVGTYLPTPGKWKGQVPKSIHQSRILNKLGWAHQVVGGKDRGYCYPVDDSGKAREPLPKTQWKHVVDAIGLAQWGMDQHLADIERTSSILNSSKRSSKSAKRGG